MNSNRKFNVLVAEDETPIREHIIDLLATRTEFYVFADVSNGEDLQTYLKNPRVDLAILDIDLPAKNTMEVLSDLGTTPPLIFITAYEEYAVEAFEIGSIDFIVKPFEEERFHKALDRCLEKIRKDVKPVNVTNQDVLWIKDNEKVFPVNTKDILFIKAKDKYTYIHTATNVYKRYSSLNGLLDCLNKQDFHQTHRAYAVNIKRINYMEPMFNGNYELHLQGTKDTIPVSRKYYRNLVKI